MRDKLPRRQEEALDHIIAFVREHHYAPSVRELGDLMGLKSVATVHAHLRGLVERGLITKAARRSRSIQLSPYEVEAVEREETILVPLISRVQPGTQVLDSCNFDGKIPIARSWLGACHGTEWLFRVTVDTACGDYRIGDYVLLRGVAARPASDDAAGPDAAAPVDTPETLETQAAPITAALSTRPLPAAPAEGEIVAVLQDGAVVLRPFARHEYISDEHSFLVGRVIGLFRPPLGERR